MILIDLGSTHNFIDITITKKSKIIISKEDVVKVRVANGVQLVSEGKGKGIKVNIQGHFVTLHFFLLELVGCDMVLVVQWLQTLEIVSWNFRKLTMQFTL